MSTAKPEVEWFYDARTYWRTYGLLGLAGKWAVVRSNGYDDGTSSYKVITDWLDSRNTAIGFVKLLMEK